VNSNHIFETAFEHDIQFDLHPARELSECIASTFIRNDQVKSQGACSYVLALICGEDEVGSLEVSITKEILKRTKSKSKSKIMNHLDRKV